MTVTDELRQEASNPETPLSRLWELSQHEDVWVRIAVAGNYQASGELLEFLSKDSHSAVRSRVFRNPRIPLNLLQLAFDDSSVHSDIAANPSTPSEILDKLAYRLRNWWEKSTLVQNPNTSAATLCKLAAKDSLTWLISARPNLDVSVLHTILHKERPDLFSGDCEGFVATPILLQESLPQLSSRYTDTFWQNIFSLLTPQHQRQLWQEGGWSFQEAYARLGQDIQALSLLAQHENRMVRRSVGRNSLTPPEVLDMLSRDPNKHVRAGVAVNPAASEALLTRLSADSNGLVRGAVSARPDAPAQALAALTQDRLPWIRARAEQSQQV